MTFLLFPFKDWAGTKSLISNKILDFSLYLKNKKTGLSQNFGCEKNATSLLSVQKTPARARGVKMSNQQPPQTAFVETGPPPNRRQRQLIFDSLAKIVSTNERPKGSAGLAPLE